MKEEWKDIIEYEGFYQISNTGKIRSISRMVNSAIHKNQRLIKGKELSLNKTNGNGYRISALSKFHKVKNKYIHRLVAQHFLENENNYLEVNHIDGNKSNNHVSNLEWCDRLFNIKHAFDTGLSKVGEDHALAKLSNKEVVEVFNLAHDGKLPQTKIANIYGISQQTVSEIKLKKTRSKK